MLKAFDFTDLLTPNAKQLTTGFDFSDLSTIQRDMSSQTATDDVIITASQSPLMPSACEVANTVASMKTENINNNSLSMTSPATSPVATSSATSVLSSFIGMSYSTVNQYDGCADSSINIKTEDVSLDSAVGSQEVPNIRAGNVELNSYLSQDGGVTGIEEQLEEIRDRIIRASKEFAIPLGKIGLSV